VARLAFPAVLSILVLASVVYAAQQAGTSANDPLAGLAWGEVADGLQLSISTGVNTEKLAESTSLLGLSVVLRNASDAPASVSMDTGGGTYDFEYEIDGTWYAFDPMTPVRTPLTASRERMGVSDYERTMTPGTSKWTMLSIPLAGRSQRLQLNAITGNDPGKQLEAKPGSHVVRVRPGRAAISGRTAPISNAVTVAFRTPSDAGTLHQSVTFTPASDTPLRELRIARGSTEDRAFILSALERPPSPGTAGQLITAEALQIWDPIPGYELRMPRRRDEPEPGLPTPTSRRNYLALAAGQLAGLIGIESSASGPMLYSIGSSPVEAGPVYRALQKLAGVPQVQGADYEPRIVQILGTRAVPSLMVLWLHSSSNRPDLFYWPRPANFRGWTKLESDKVYAWAEFLQVAQVLPVAPKHDEAWAVSAAMSCARAPSNPYPNTLLPERAVVDIGLGDQQDRIVWYVFIPEPRDPRRIVVPQPGAALLVDEADGSCIPVMRE